MNKTALRVLILNFDYSCQLLAFFQASYSFLLSSRKPMEIGLASILVTFVRSEERRVGKEWASMVRSRWSPVHEKKKKNENMAY